jgi:hypothetical protein
MGPTRNYLDPGSDTNHHPRRGWLGLGHGNRFETLRRRRLARRWRRSIDDALVGIDEWHRARRAFRRAER